MMSGSNDGCGWNSSGGFHSSRADLCSMLVGLWCGIGWLVVV